jgi:hypothetical protein
MEKVQFGPKAIGYNMLLGHITNWEKLVYAQLQLVDAFRCNNKSL